MKHPSSFRDPCGFVFTDEGRLLRQINLSYRNQYDRLMESGLYKHLTDSGLLIKHKEVACAFPEEKEGYKVIEPTSIQFISYPFEWCFSQLKAAALTTLEIQKICMDYGMTLKDASAYNVQLYKGKFTFIDTLSFDILEPGDPWVAYRQFCRHFLAPLLLMKYCSVHFGTLSRVHLDGIPLDLASSCLPRKSYLNLSVLTHIHFHSRMEMKSSDVPKKPEKKSFGKNAMAGLVDALTGFVRKLRLPDRQSIWKDYYNNTNYTSETFEKKKQLTSSFLDAVKPGKVLDLGANTGVFSRLASIRGIPTISMDLDPYAVEQSWDYLQKEGDQFLFPLVMDLTNPSPAIGWANQERHSLLERGKADAIFALALVHHLAIGNNLPFDKITDFFSRLGTFALIEFIPKQDSQVQRLLASREDIFPDYNQECFKKSLSGKFEILQEHALESNGRVLFWLRKK